MTRTRIVLTLVLVAMVAMLVGFGMSTYVVRRFGAPVNGGRPEATEPERSPAAAAVVVNV